MTKIFLVLSNLKHDTETYEKGSFFAGELATFQSLVNENVLRVIEGASSIEEAKDIVAEAEVETEESSEEVTVEPTNTWGPTKEVEASTEEKVEEDVTENKEAEVETEEENKGEEAPAEAGDNL